jgi:hypothetical protein
MDDGTEFSFENLWQYKARVGVLETELAELQQRMCIAEALRSKAWLTITMPTENDVWYAGYEGILAWQVQHIYMQYAI